MKKANIRLKLDKLDGRKKAAFQQQKDSLSEENKIDDEIFSLIASCLKTSGKKFGGSNDGDWGEFWIVCDICGRNHVLTKKKFDTYLGEITWIGVVDK